MKGEGGETRTYHTHCHYLAKIRGGSEYIRDLRVMEKKSTIKKEQGATWIAEKKVAGLRPARPREREKGVPDSSRKEQKHLPRELSKWV